MLWGDPYPCVLHLQCYELPIGAPADTHLTAPGRIFDGVVQEIEHKLQHEVLVGLYGKGGAWVVANRDPLVGSRGTDLLNDPGHDVTHIDCLKGQGDLAGIGASQGEETPGQADEAVHLFVDPLEHLPVGLRWTPKFGQVAKRESRA